MTLPSFLVIGGSKAGATSLCFYLKEHPQIFMSEIKETSYFAYDGPEDEPRLFPIRGLEEYEKLFDGPVKGVNWLPPEER